MSRLRPPADAVLGTPGEPGLSARVLYEILKPDERHILKELRRGARPVISRDPPPCGGASPRDFLRRRGLILIHGEIATLTERGVDLAAHIALREAEDAAEEAETAACADIILMGGLTAEGAA